MKKETKGKRKRKKKNPPPTSFALGVPSRISPHRRSYVQKRGIKGSWEYLWALRLHQPAPLENVVELGQPRPRFIHYNCITSQPGTHTPRSRSITKPLPPAAKTSQCLYAPQSVRYSSTFSILGAQTKLTLGIERVTGCTSRSGKVRDTPRQEKEKKKTALIQTRRRRIKAATVDRCKTPVHLPAGGWSSRGLLRRDPIHVLNLSIPNRCRVAAMVDCRKSKT
ncbi:hypothetical protein LY78DRAFT_478131 [Colletotrichum sublineola]|nr:hypothetical protein LY78DRAFT_478131 [Colletotrichum sublineola]